MLQSAVSDYPGGLAMYALIIVIAVLSSSGIPVGVTSHVMGTYENLEQCKSAADKPQDGGPIFDLNLARGIYWHCVYTPTR
jgi:hypothetical protein